MEVQDKTAIGMMLLWDKGLLLVAKGVLASGLPWGVGRAATRAR